MGHLTDDQVIELHQEFTAKLGHACPLSIRGILRDLEAMETELDKRGALDRLPRPVGDIFTVDFPF